MSTARLPDFICVGPGRTGTSWLREMLEAHPDVALSSVKETEFFNNNFHKGADWYKSQFLGASKVCGEISNMYYVDDTVPEKILNAVPNCKIILAIREPKSLLQSFYKFGIRRGVAEERLMDALDQPVSMYMGSGYQARNASNTLTPGDRVSLLNSVMLSSYIENYIRVFGAESVFILPFERLADSSESTLREVYGFLGVDDSFTPDGINEIVNPSLFPRSRIVANIAHKTAFTLRYLGLNRCLSALHKSRILKNILFRTRAESNKSDNFDFHLDTNIEEKLEKEYESMCQKTMAPDLSTEFSTNRPELVGGR